MSTPPKQCDRLDSHDEHEWYDGPLRRQCAGRTPPFNISDEAVAAFASAALAAGGTIALPSDQQIRAGLEAVAPLIAVQVLHAYADDQHPHPVGHSRQVDYGTGIEYDTECGGCGSSWSETEGGCTERVELIRAANALVAPTGPDCNCHETGAPCDCADADG